jgi:hypothetical protein
MIKPSKGHLRGAECHGHLVRYQVLTAVIIKLVFWDVAPCSLVEIDRCFRSSYSLRHQNFDGFTICPFKELIIF